MEQEYKPIEWRKIKDEYFSDQRYELVIYKKENFWILSYTDYWTSSIYDSFFVNIKASGDKDIAIARLKGHAEEIIKTKILLKKIREDEKIDL